MYNSELFANRLLLKSKEKKATFASLAKVCGISKNTVSSWKNAGTLPNTKTLMQIAEYLGCSIDYLLGADDVQNCLSQDEKELVALYRSLGGITQKAKLVAFIDKIEQN